MNATTDTRGNVQVSYPLWVKIASGVVTSLLITIILLGGKAVSEWSNARDDIPNNTALAMSNKEAITALANSNEILAIAVKANTDFRNQGPRVTATDLGKIEQGFDKASERQNALLSDYIATSRENTKLLTVISRDLGIVQTNLENVVQEQDRAREERKELRRSP